MNSKMSRLLLLVVAAVGAMVLSAAMVVAQSSSGPASIELEVHAIGGDVPPGFEYSLTAYLGEPGPATPIELDTKVTHEGLAPDTYTLSLETVPPDVLVEWASCYFSDSGRGQSVGVGVVRDREVGAG